MSLGTMSRSSSNNSNPIGQRHHFINIVDRVGEDRFRIDGNSASNEDLFRIMIRDGSPSPPDFISVGTGNLSGRPPISSPDLGLVQFVCTSPDLNCYSGTDSYNASGQPLGSLVFEVNELSVTGNPVPIPTSLPLLAAGFGLLLFAQTKTAATTIRPDSSGS